MRRWRWQKIKWKGWRQWEINRYKFEKNIFTFNEAKQKQIKVVNGWNGKKYVFMNLVYTFYVFMWINSIFGSRIKKNKMEILYSVWWNVYELNFAIVDQVFDTADFNDFMSFLKNFWQLIWPKKMKPQLSSFQMRLIT